MIETSDAMGAGAFLAQLGPEGASGLRLDRLATRLGVAEESPGAIASALEFCLEGLHLLSRLNKVQNNRTGSWAFSEGPR